MILRQRIDDTHVMKINLNKYKTYSYNENKLDFVLPHICVFANKSIYVFSNRVSIKSDRSADYNDLVNSDETPEISVKLIIHK